MSNQTNGVVFLSDVRLSFPHIVEPQVQKSEKTGQERITYNADFLMPADHPGFAQFMARFGEIAVAEWKEHSQTVMGMINQDPKSRCYGAGDQKINKKTFKPYDGYVGQIYISAGNKNMPQLIQHDGTPVNPENTMAYKALARKLYGGCRVNVAVKPWAQIAKDNYGNGIRCDLVAIQFLRDDQPFGEAPVDATGMFGAVAQTPQSGVVQTGVPGMPVAPGMQIPVTPQMPAVPFGGNPGMPVMPGLPSFFGNR